MRGTVVAALLAGSLALLGAAGPASAHHAINAVVDTDTELTSDMVLTKVDWINPHAWFHFTMKSASGKTLKDVMIEWLSLAGFKQAGYSGVGVFGLGDTYKVTYNPNRDGTPGGHIVRMVDDNTGKVFER